ncbi:sulfite exporter TauE/SafE family protein [Salibacterium aidingense]|uniref:sulfite exporter TauE/SafE family protein n=1 Tax=Salibacterium aidingense TaxID=384933 RepID=UPI003BCB85AA
MLLTGVIVFIVLFIGSFIQGASGFGFGLFAMSFLPFLFTVKDSTLLVMALALVTCITIFLKVYKHIDFKKLGYLLTGAIVGRIGAYFVLHHYGEMDAMKKILGFVLIGMVVYILLQKNPQERKQAENPVFPIVIGGLGGFIGGVFVVGGPFFVFYLLMVCKDKYAYSANIQAVFVLSALVTLLLHGFSGDLHLELLVYFFIGFLSVIAGSRLGMMWFKRLSQENIKKLASIIVALAGLNLIIFA